MADIDKLKQFIKMKNIATDSDMDDDDVMKIGQRILTGFNEDLESCQEWLSDVKRVEELASLTSRKKNYPLPNSANVKFPLITKASYEFSSRTYPEIMKDGKVVKARVVGMDPDNTKSEKADRVSDFMNFQLLFEHMDWEKDLDTLLTRLSLIGFICKKSYYDPIRKKIKNKLCDPHDLIIHCDVKSLEDARRISHIMHFRLNDLLEGVKAGIYCSEPVDEIILELGDNELDKKIDLIEQHTFLDLDDDGYAEPYIVTVLKETGKVLRIAARFAEDNIQMGKDDDGKSEVKYIDPIQLFTDYHFLVSPKGKFQSVGFGILMLHLNESINTILNQLIDAGQLANLQGGYRDSRLKNMGSGNSLHDPGEWKTVKAMAGVTIKEGMVPISYKEPSQVLFKLLELLIQTGKELSSSTEVMTGATQADNAKTGAVQALQSESLKIFTSIQKRMYRSLTNEFRRLYSLNALYQDQKMYYDVLGDRKHVMKEDFDLQHVDVIPVADPNLSSEMQRNQRNQILLALQSLPGTNKLKLTEMIITNSNLSVPVKEVMLPPEQINKPTPEMLELQAKIENMGETNKLKGHELMIKEREVQVEFYKVQCQCLELKARAMLEIAQAQAQTDNGKYKEYSMQLDILSQHMDAMQSVAQYDQVNKHHDDDMAIQQQQLAAQQQQAQAQQQQQGQPQQAAAAPQDNNA